MYVINKSRFLWHDSGGYWDRWENTVFIWKNGVGYEPVYNRGYWCPRNQNYYGAIWAGTVEFNSNLPTYPLSEMKDILGMSERLGMYESSCHITTAGYDTPNPTYSWFQLDDSNTFHGWFWPPDADVVKAQIKLASTYRKFLVNHILGV